VPGVTAKTIPEMLLARVQATPEADAFLYPKADGWRSLTWKQVGDEAAAVAAALRAQGLKDEDRCAILSGTRVEWILVDFGILCAGAATTTIYPSNTAEECAFILQDSSTVFVFAENEDQVRKLLQVRAQIPSVQKVITFDGSASPDGWVIRYADFLAQGHTALRADPGMFERIVRSVKPSALATLIYTSGTTGRPKGVELTQDCWVYTSEAIDNLHLLTAQDRQYLWLPLSHSFGKVLLSAQVRIGFPTAVDGRVEKMVDNLSVIRPTFVAAVPRVFEKVHNKVVAGAKEGGPLKEAIFRWAMGVGRQVSALVQEGRKPSGRLALQHVLADRLVFSKLRARFGGNLRMFISGSAPLSKYVAEFFHAANIMICEGYGLTETSAASFVNRPERFRFGTVGPPLPGTEVKIAPDGEILIRGRGLMRGYHNLPDATHEVFEADGFFRTGDIGVIEPGEFLRITDRKKDLIKTSGGKYIAPQALEGKLKASCPFVSQVVVHGNNRNFCVALIALDEEAIRQWAAENGLAGKSYRELSQDSKTRALIEPYIAELNKGLASYESIKSFAILPEDLTVDSGALTPSLKLKRKAVETQYASLLDDFYRESVARI
jgi:long-chain acyl-CoA synthetase